MGIQDKASQDTLLMWALREKKAELAALLLPATQNVGSHCLLGVDVGVGVGSGVDQLRMVCSRRVCEWCGWMLLPS